MGHSIGYDSARFCQHPHPLAPIACCTSSQATRTWLTAGVGYAGTSSARRWSSSTSDAPPNFSKGRFSLSSLGSRRCLAPDVRTIVLGRHLSRFSSRTLCRLRTSGRA
jgi:hypothetical protein